MNDRASENRTMRNANITMTILTIIWCVGMIIYGWLFTAQNPAHTTPHPEWQMNPVEKYTTPSLNK